MFTHARLMLGREVLFLTELVSRLSDDDVVLLSLCQSSQFPVPVFLAADHLFDSGARMCSQCRHVFSVSTLVGTEADCPPSPLLSPVFVHGPAFRPWPCYTYHGPQRVLPLAAMQTFTSALSESLARVPNHHVVVLLWTLQSCFYMWCSHNTVSMCRL